MRIEIPYLDRSFTVEVPGGTALLEPKEADPTAGSRDLIREAAGAPLGTPPLEEFLAGEGRTLIVINDATRPTPTRKVLDALCDSLDCEDVRFLVATGAHRAPSEEEYRWILGRHYARFRDRVSAHDARDEGSLMDLGRTRFGTPIRINRAVLESDRILVIGSVEPHYFAGYTGGRKAFLPGVAGYASIEANHRQALDPRARACALEDNPVSLDMEDALGRIPRPIFAIMTVLDRNQTLAACTAGDIRESFHAAVRLADSIFAVPLRERADIVISVARHPMDIDLYQSQKAIDNGALALADDGILVVVASCRDGVGDRAYLDLLGASRTPAAALESIGRAYRLGYHKAAKIAEVASRARIFMVSELDEPTLAKAFLEKHPDPSSAFLAAWDAKGPDARVAVLLDGTVTVPRVDGT